ncbi:MAG: alanine racemase [Blastocatellia bacterium]|nr:alanine racemase [Blastocatellia bacterium]
MTSPSQRPTWAEISLSALRENYRHLKARLTAGAQLMAVVKADAYGHGAVACARALEAIGADGFGVALVEEGAALRRASIVRPILCLGGFWRGQADEVLANELTPALFRLDQAEELQARARSMGRAAGIHLKIDTGMGRLGVPMAELAAFARELKRFDHLRLEGLMTHFADADGEETAYTERQIALFEEGRSILRAAGWDPGALHLGASAGLHAYPESHGTLARAGASLYGLTRDVLTPRLAPLDVRPVMSLHSRIVMLKTVPAGATLGYGRTFTTTRESRIATLPIGYADGWRRALSNQGRGLLRGRFAPIVGRVSMDLTLLDVTEIGDAALGDPVTLLGEQAGLRISAEEVAQQIGSISYEVVTGISARVPRIFPAA